MTSYTWTAHAATTYGRCPNGTGAFATTAASTKGAANDCAPLGPDQRGRVDGGPPATGSSSSTRHGPPSTSPGCVFKDNDDTHTYVIPAGTIDRRRRLPGPRGGGLRLRPRRGRHRAAVRARRHHARRLVRLDRARDHDLRPLPERHRRRSPRPRSSTKGAPNDCAGDGVAAPWPGGADGRHGRRHRPVRRQPQRPDLRGRGSATPGVLWAVDNGPGALLRLDVERLDLDARHRQRLAAAGKTLRYPDGTGSPGLRGRDPAARRPAPASTSPPSATTRPTASAG